MSILMNELIWILASTILVSLFSFVGVLALSLKKEFMKSITIILVSLAAGALIGGAFLHLIPEAVEASEESGMSIDTLFLSVIGGFVIFFLIEKAVHWRHCHDVECKIHTFGYMNLIGDAVHNFIDGLVIAVAFLTDFKTGVATTIAIVFHEIPQEIGDFGVLIHGGFEKRKALLFNFLTALTAVLGGAFGFFLSSRMQWLIPMLLPIASGGFIYIAASDLIPEMRKEVDPKKSAVILLVFLIGIGLMMLTKMIFD